MRPTVSVVMPAYNAERHLREAVDTVLAQTMDDFELIVVNDGSTDRTGEILAEISDPRLRVIDQANAGIGAALNAGIAASVARLIARADADDLNHPDRLARQVRYLSRHRSVTLLGTSFRAFREPGEWLYVVIPLRHDWEIRRDMYLRCPLGHPTVMFRREAFDAAGGYDPDAVVEDWDLWRRFPGRFANLPDVLVDYRVHGAQYTSGLAPEAVEEARQRVTGTPPPLHPWHLTVGLWSNRRKAREYLGRMRQVEQLR